MQTMKAFVVFVAVFAIEQASAAVNTNELAKALHNKLSSILEPELMFAPAPPGSNFQVRPQPVSPKLDFLLVLDSSGSITAEHFEWVKDNGKVLVDYIHGQSPIGTYGSRVGLIEYSTQCKTHVEFSFCDYNTVSTIKNRISQVKFDNGGSTATGPALQLAKTELDIKGRPGNVRVVWVITDGKSNSGVKPKIPADDLRANGVMVCVVGVGNSVNDVELNQIGDSGCVFRSDSYSQLKTAARMAYNLSQPQLSSGFFNNLSFKRV
ncbi:von Willebrand factor A domain-containing protein 2-like [Lingula anatina]|uniref:von Willebrand factor A domain-containing protein 2-like n=1 Tax=Lingula anatina TaxID=7574 RepID=A0A1S3IS38_LINAN|nr:von Willebrand factor A domain-containing protein 2-like [Lingula anatina]|eukprot:XP_013401017.1 von Willebrand factor A domain-containing protein 2-like [Lingula anatina]